MATTFTLPPEGEKRGYKVIPEGTHTARCISFIDIGTHEFEWQGEKKTPRKVRIAWETPEETTVFDEEKGEQPFLVSTELTMSFHEKSNLFGMLSGWIGMTEKNKNEFDPEKDLIGQPCLINIKHSETKSGNKFAKIMGVTPLPKGMKCPDQVNKETYFHMGWCGMPSEFDDETFAGLPKFIQEKIMQSPEYGKAKSDPTERSVTNLNSDGELKMSEKEILDILD